MTQFDSGLLSFELRHLPKTLRRRAAECVVTAMERSQGRVCEDSRHSQMQSTAAMMSATQLSPIGI